MTLACGRGGQLAAGWEGRASYMLCAGRPPPWRQQLGCEPAAAAALLYPCSTCRRRATQGVRSPCRTAPAASALAHALPLTSSPPPPLRPPSPLQDAKLSYSDIDEVILVGGSTRIPAVQELVQKLSGARLAPGISIFPKQQNFVYRAPCCTQRRPRLSPLLVLPWCLPLPCRGSATWLLQCLRPACGLCCAPAHSHHSGSTNCLRAWCKKKICNFVLQARPPTSPSTRMRSWRSARRCRAACWPARWAGRVEGGGRAGGREVGGTVHRSIPEGPGGLSGIWWPREGPLGGREMGSCLLRMLGLLWPAESPFARALRSLAPSAHSPPSPPLPCPPSGVRHCAAGRDPALAGPGDAGRRDDQDHPQVGGAGGGERPVAWGVPCAWHSGSYGDQCSRAGRRGCRLCCWRRQLRLEPAPRPRPRLYTSA